MPRFVILEHDWPSLHWDFMLEAGEVLRTWRLAAVPERGKAIAATALGDHRLAYLSFEGSLSGNRGQVIRWDAGTFSWLVDDQDRISVELIGAKVRGVVELKSAAGDAWSFRLE